MAKLHKFYPIEVRSIDAWAEPEGGWSYNQTFKILGFDEKNYLHEEITHRKILEFMREKGFLTDYSKGKVYVNSDIWPHIEIGGKTDGQPWFEIYLDEENYILAWV